MRVYVPAPCTFWGDNITGLWASELLRKLDPCAKITLDVTGHRNKNGSTPFDHREYLEIDWIDQGIFRGPTMREALKTHDRVLATHHRHTAKHSIYEGISGDRLAFFDAHGLSFRFIADQWFPSFKPTTKLKAEIAKLYLPPEYCVVHFIEPVIGGRDNRHVQTSADFYRDHWQAIKASAGDVPIVTTGVAFPGTIDASKAGPWATLGVMIGAYKLWGSYSGFTAIAATYRQSQNSEVINEPGLMTFNMGPPIICYSNYGISSIGSLEAMRYAAFMGIFPDCRGVAYGNRCDNRTRHWCQFETFDETHPDRIVVPHGWRLGGVDYGTENCVVPLDAQYCSARAKHALDFRRDREMLAQPFMPNAIIPNYIRVGWQP